MKSLVKGLSDSFGGKLKENLSIGLNLPQTMNLAQFRDCFSNKLNIDFSVGFAIFQLLKNFSHKDEQIISKDDLFNFLESYQDKQLTDKISIETVIGRIELMGAPLKYCFDIIPYSVTGQD